MICRYPQVKSKEKHKWTQNKCTNDPILRLTYKKGPQTKRKWVRQVRSAQGIRSGLTCQPARGRWAWGSAIWVWPTPWLARTQTGTRPGAFWWGVAPTQPQARGICLHINSGGNRPLWAIKGASPHPSIHSPIQPHKPFLMWRRRVERLHHFYL